MPSAWDAAADRDLLLGIIEDGKLQALDWRSIASKMAAKGYTFSHEACRQHYQKLRREASNGAGSTPATPSRAIKTTKKTPGSRKSAKKLMEDNRDDEENEDPDTPSKKRKRVEKKEEEDLGGLNGQSALQFKMEALSSDEAGVIDLEEDLYA